MIDDELERQARHLVEVGSAKTMEEAWEKLARIHAENRTAWPETGAEPDRVPVSSREGSSVALEYPDGSPAGHVKVHEGTVDEDGGLHAPDLNQARIGAAGLADLQASVRLARAGGIDSVCRDLVATGRCSGVHITRTAVEMSGKFGGDIRPWQEKLREAQMEHRRRQVLTVDPDTGDSLPLVDLPERLRSKGRHEQAAAAEKMVAERLSQLGIVSGHWQDQNQPGNQDKIEIARPSILRMIQERDPSMLGNPQTGYIDPELGYNPKTGAVLTIENPLGRQMYATEQAGGFESGQPGHKLFKIGPVEVDAPPSVRDAFQGLDKSTMARMNPAIETLAGLANIDLYQSLTSGIPQSGSIDYLDPSHNLGPGLTTTLLDALQTLPGGQNAEFTAQQQIEQQMQGPYGTSLPRAVGAVTQGLQKNALLSLLGDLTGVNPPYAAATKTESQAQPTNAQYQQVDQIDSKYVSQMNQLAAELASGQITPSEWHQTYSQISQTRADQLQAIFHGSSAYVNGTDGLLARYYALESSPDLYNSDGSFNEDAFLAQRDRFLKSLTSSQRTALDGAIAKDQQKYPVVALYEGAIDQYQLFQQQWAQENGISAQQLRQETTEYGKLYGDQRAAQQYEAEHPELMQWESAKRMWEMQSGGILYGLFMGSDSAYEQEQLDPELVTQGEESALQLQQEGPVG